MSFSPVISGGRIQTPSNMFQKLAHFLESLEGEEIVNGD
jgi:hypothetical protein